MAKQPLQYNSCWKVTIEEDGTERLIKHLQIIDWPDYQSQKGRKDFVGEPFYPLLLPLESWAFAVCGSAVLRLARSRYKLLSTSGPIKPTCPKSNSPDNKCKNVILRCTKKYK